MANVWETKAGQNAVENLNKTLGELREYMRTQNEINLALLSEVRSLKDEVISLHNNKVDKTTEEIEREGK